MEINKIYNEDCLVTRGNMPGDFIDLTVTSPPYDNLRTYLGYTFDFESVAKELYRVTKQGGVVVWVVGDATVKGSETGTSFKHALYFKDCGFNLHDTMIYEKSNFSHPEKIRYHSVFEYMFILTKGKLKTFNPIKDKKNITAGAIGNLGVNTFTKKDGSKSVSEKRVTAEYGMRGNVWKGKTRGQEEMCIPLNHPAMMPKWIASDQILSWSNPSDIVYDPFSGSGTTAMMAVRNGRNYIGSEISSEYCSISEQRLETL